MLPMTTKRPNSDQEASLIVQSVETNPMFMAGPECF
jgi:hypothetical protein